MFQRSIKGLAVLALLTSLGACSLLNPENGAGDSAAAAKPQQVFRQPQLSVSAAQAASLESAYRQQRQAVNKALGNHAPSGFKAGLTTSEGQQRFNLSEPIAGVLWPDSEIVSAGTTPVIRRGSFRLPMLEVELAFRVNTLIPEPLASVAEVRHVISDIMPAVELPDLGFDSEVGMTGEAVVAANAAVRHYLLGEPRPVDMVDVNAVRTTLIRDGQILERAEATQVMGSQWRSLYWLINKMVSEGWVIQPGQILLSGAMGTMLPLKEGLYQVKYSELGELRFQVE